MSDYEHKLLEKAEQAFHNNYRTVRNTAIAEKLAVPTNEQSELSCKGRRLKLIQETATVAAVHPQVLEKLPAEMMASPVNEKAKAQVADYIGQYLSR